MYSVPSTPKAGEATKAATVALEVVQRSAPVVTSRQVTLRRPLPKQSAPSLLIAGEETTAEPANHLHCNTVEISMPDAALVARWRLSRPYCPQTCANGDGLGVTDAEVVGDVVAVAVTDAVLDTEGVNVAVVDPVVVGDAEPDDVTLALAVTLAVKLIVGETDGVADALGLATAYTNASSEPKNTVASRPIAMDERQAPLVLKDHNEEPEDTDRASMTPPTLPKRTAPSRVIAGKVTKASEESKDQTTAPVAPFKQYTFKSPPPMMTAPLKATAGEPSTISLVVNIHATTPVAAFIAYTL
jgi:hypothetical protein